MLTLLLRFPTAVLLVVFIASGAVSGEVVMKAVGDKVSFHPDKPLPSPVSSIIWKHRKGGDVIKAIEWDVDDGFGIPNPRFQKITALDNRTGVITITGLKVEHTGVYTIDINSKEQEQRFTLTVKERVPKPEIKVEKTSDPNVVYLRCEYSETIIWKNSAGDILKGNPISPKGESLTVEKNGDPNNYYNCTLDNGASQETSDPVKEEDLFKDGSGSGIEAGGIFGIVIVLICGIIAIIAIVLYKLHVQFRRLF
ncbi:CD48 antigen-like [Pseudorasbora parva]|uniref:CD48 antigen-like n=1 Tax=Pseudorasbora parva TaxID=51549 RepID=UPI00351DF7AC